MRTILTFFIAFGLLGSCYSAGPENRKLWNEEADRKEFVRELQARKIPFRIDGEGAIWYSPADAKAVDEVTKLVLDRNTFDGLSLEDSRDVALLKQALQQSGIPYETKRQLGREWITWDKRFDTQVKSIHERVEQESTERARAERASQAEKSFKSK